MKRRRDNERTCPHCYAAWDPYDPDDCEYITPEKMRDGEVHEITGELMEFRFDGSARVSFAGQFAHGYTVHMTAAQMKELMRAWSMDNNTRATIRVKWNEELEQLERLEADEGGT